MILLFQPRATRPRNRRFPLSLLAIGAVLEGKEEYAIVDGNVDPQPLETLDRLMREKPAEMLAVSVMPGPQMVAAIPVCRAFRQRYPKIPIVWGGYFASLFTDAALNANYVDFAVRGQGEETFLELVEAIRSGAGYRKIRGLSYKDQFGLHVHNAERPLRSPGDFPWFPYHRLDASKYIVPTFLGSHTTVHMASVGCPFRCNFCGVVPIYDREKMEPPGRTAAILAHQQREFGVNAVQFYDNNFFLKEDHARDLADRLAPLQLRWWCEARVDVMLGYSDDTLRKLERAGLKMIFMGVESGSDAVLADMRKGIRSEQILEFAKRARDFHIIPEYSFIFGDPRDSARETRRSIDFIRRVKKINPAVEIIVQTYVPTPQRDGMYGGVETQVQFPTTPDEWATERWYRFTTRTDPELPWLPAEVKRRIEGFDTVVTSRWPTVQDIRMPRWGRWLLKSLSSWRYAFGCYDHPVELKWLREQFRLRDPRYESL
jgi:anaerobic magnesium-protoporphyrin IX monomethyl ester cyclase